MDAALELVEPLTTGLLQPLGEHLGRDAIVRVGEGGKRALVALGDADDHQILAERERGGHLADLERHRDVVDRLGERARLHRAEIAALGTRGRVVGEALGEIGEVGAGAGGRDE